MNETATIPKDISTQFGKDYAWLREQGLQYIEKLAGRVWTDYNAHDPGISILELLCWVITDLGYRMSMPVQDIVARDEDNTASMHRQFLSALSILPAAPVTEHDYRKLFIRIEGVRNAWMQKARHSIIADHYHQPPRLRYAFDNEAPVPGKEMKFELNGLYNILLDIEEKFEDKLPEITARVKSVFHHFRNLCEDVVEVGKVPSQEIVLCGEIELDARADPEDVWARIIYEVQLYLSPEIHFYNLEEMLERNVPVQEIFEGPVFDYGKVPVTGTPSEDARLFAKKGFVDDAEVKKSGLRGEVRLSDLMRLIMKIDGVRVIRNLQFGFCGCDEKDRFKINQVLNQNNWLLCVNEGHKPVLCLTNSVINFYKDVIPVELKETEASIKLQALRDAAIRANELRKITDMPMPEGRFRDIKNYHSLQQHLPEIYGIGPAGLPGSATPGRRAQAKQLKAYLLFFDQVLANYFSQLSHVNELLGADPGMKQTYFSNAVKGIPGVEEIFTEAANWEAGTDAVLRQAKLENYATRKNKLLDHLLARFAEQFNEYVFLLHRIYGDDYDNAIIRHKQNFLDDYHNLSAFRADALDYYNQKTAFEQSINVSGMEKRVSRLLGFNHYRRQALSQLPYKIFHTVEGDPFSNYTWTLTPPGLTALNGNTYYGKQADAYEDMGLVTILGCEPENYRYIPSGDGKKVTVEVVNSTNQTLARSAVSFDVLEGELQSGRFSKALEAVAGLVQYLLNEFRLEGMYVIEHMILRPGLSRKGQVLDSFLPICVDVNGKYCKPLDPYSFRIAVILPGYTMRLRNMEFRKYAERLIRMETPAHILPRICFIGEDQMIKFEEVYNRWLEARISSAKSLEQVPDELNKEFIDVLEKLYTVYESGQLGDCDDDTVERNPIILGRTNLGTLETPGD